MYPIIILAFEISKTSDVKMNGMIDAFTGCIPHQSLSSKHKQQWQYMLGHFEGAMESCFDNFQSINQSHIYTTINGEKYVEGFSLNFLV